MVVVVVAAAAVEAVAAAAVVVAAVVVVDDSCRNSFAAIVGHFVGAHSLLTAAAEVSEVEAWKSQNFEVQFDAAAA